jgi:hypothetical protein
MSNDYESIVGIPSVIGEITSLGKWDQSDYCWDPYEDILTASNRLPRSEIPRYLVVNKVAKSYLYRVNCERVPVIEEIPKIFGYSIPGNTCCDLVTSTIKETIIKSVLRTDNNLPDDVVLLVSNKNSIVVIHV